MRILYPIFLLLSSLLILHPATAQDIKINEIMTSNASTISDEEEDQPDWIELFNAGTAEVNLAGYGLSDDYDTPFKWVLPEVTIPAGGYLLIWASGKDRRDKPDALHTNFSLSAAGEELILSRPGEERIDEIPPTNIPTDVSFGRYPTGGDSFNFFSAPTPGTANTTAGAEEILNAPEFSHTGGVYTSAFDLSISSPDPEATILYTLDGSVPDPDNLSGTTFSFKNNYQENSGDPVGSLMSSSFTSHDYTGPLTISDRSGEEDQLSVKSSTYHRIPYYAPDDPVFKGTVVKAVAVKSGALPSEPTTHTYFVSPGKHYSLPIVSLSVQEDALFDYEKGIYTAGKIFDEWRTSNPNAGVDGGKPANYHTDREYPAHIEIFEGAQGRVFSQDIGIRIHGGHTRSFPAKSIRLYARNEYGPSEMNYAFFPDQPYSSYKRLILRNSGNDWYHTLFRDAAIQSIVGHMNFDTQAYQPAILFINGEYWGIHNFRERYDKHYLARKYGLDPDNIDLFTGNMWADEGDANHYQATLNYIEANGLRDDEHYAYIKTRIDVDNFIDYQLAQIFAGNTDWPGNNIKAWRAKPAEYDPDAPEGQDGRWRWLMYDTDFGFGLYNSAAYTEDILSFATAPHGPDWPNPSWSTFLLRKLLENESFRNSFINRFTDQLNSALRPEVTEARISSMKQQIEPEMAEHIRRWEHPGSVNDWNKQVNDMLNFARQRPAHQREHIRQHFDLGKDYQLSVDVSHPNHGHIKVNSLELDAATEGMPDKIFPWTGDYFEGVPLSLEAVPAPGYVFVGWEGASTASSEKILLEPEGDQSLLAVFERQQDAPALIHYWNFNSTDQLLQVSYSLTGGNLEPNTAAETDTEITSGSGNGFTGENAWFEEAAATHLRVNNPLGAELDFSLPTTGFSELRFQYESRRSGQGAGTQIIEYTTDGNTFVEKERIRITDGDPMLYTLDFSGIAAVNDNENFAIRILFEAGEGGTAGNNRFDNITLTGTAMEGTPLPPLLVATPGLQDFIENEGERQIDISEIFEDPQGAPLELTVSSSQPEILQATAEDETLHLTPLRRGETALTLTADNGQTPPVSTTIRLMVYPEAFPLAEADFHFSAWDPMQPEMTFPEHMLFLQSETDDPTAEDPLEHAYYIPHAEYHEDDQENVGFPYNNTRRSRINGLGEEGISFLNTGQGRDLGGVLLALNSTGVEEYFMASWLNSTLAQNERSYGIRLQYRYSLDEPFKDLQTEGSIAEYSSQEDGHTATTGPLKLPVELLNREYLQLLWRYHHISGNSGPRAEIRLDDIAVGARLEMPPVTGLDKAGKDKIVVESFPNPFQQGTTLKVTLPNRNKLSITLHDLAGKMHAEIASGELSAGSHAFSIDASQLSPGVYIIICQFEKQQAQHKLIKY